MKTVTYLFNVCLVTCCSLGLVIEPFDQRHESRQLTDNAPTSFASLPDNNIASDPVTPQYQVHHDKHKYHNTENIRSFKTGYDNSRTNQDGIVGTITSEHGYGCPSRDDSFYRHFDDAVNDINHHIRKDNTNKKPCACTEGPFIFCNCSTSNLTSVPQDITTDVKSLDLSGNRIHSLDGSPFQKYPQLLFLSLHRNNIERISLDSFQGLEKLHVLDLGTNSLEMKVGTYPVGAFAHLTSLVALRINNNNRNPAQPDLVYPDQALAHLKSLKFLSMDGIGNTTFGKGFGDMKSLETLSISGYHDGICHIEYLSDISFQYLGNIKMLNMSDCHCRGNSINTHVFLPLKELAVIDFTWNERISIDNMARILSGLRDSNLEELHMSRVENRFSPGTRIYSSYMDNLPRNLTCLVAVGNSINEIDSDVLGRLPKSLRHLDISANKMVFGNYLRNLSLLENLESLRIDGDKFVFDIPRGYPSPLVAQTGPEYRNPVTSLQTDADHESNFTLSLPPKLRQLAMENAGLMYYLTQLSVNETNQLEELHLASNAFPSVEGSFRGFNRLKMLDLAHCQIFNLEEKFFKHFPSLEHLDLYGNFLGFGTSLSHHHPFKYLTKLKYLQIGNNNLVHLSSDAFLGLDSLQELHIKTNSIHRFNARIAHMKRLEILNLNDTEISELLPNTRKNIDSITKVTVYMADTPLRCQCATVKFVEWMAQSKAVPKHLKYTCILRSLAELVLDWNQFLNEVNIIKRECTKNYGLLLVVIGVTLLFLVLTIGGIVYRFRWRLRYFYYALLIWIDRPTNEREEGQFTYDVFLSYASEDFDFVMSKILPELNSRDVSVCVHTRDFLAGEKIITNIIRSIKQSRRTLIILTRNLLDSKWCRCEFQMAKEESLTTGRKVLVFLIAEKIPKNKIGLELLTHIEQNSYLPYCGNVTDHSNNSGETSQALDRQLKILWDRLARDIKA